ncbi:MAG: 50S ribosomal protein L28 [Rhodospirillaceae bacterium]|nr:50S ribosomal protein L28 [Rhodospirillaceae bacterium]
MARRCVVTGKGVQSGNNVSHSLRRTRRRFLPNMQTSTLFSDALQEAVRVRVSTHGLRSIEHMGGLDTWLVSSKADALPTDLRRMKKRVEAVRAERAAAEA